AAWLCGALLGVAFLMREPLVIFAFPVLIYVLLAGSWRDAARVVGGSTAAVMAGLLGLGMLRGGQVLAAQRHIGENWPDLSAMYRTLAGLDQFDRLAHMRAQVVSTMDVAGWAVPIWIAGILLAMRACRRRPQLAPLAIAAGLMALAPLPEFILKHGFPYH